MIFNYIIKKFAFVSIMILLYKIHIFSDVILMWNEVIINGKITKITYKKENDKLKMIDLTIKTEEGDYSIENKFIINYWQTENFEEDIEIYKKLNKKPDAEIVEKIKANHKKNKNTKAEVKIIETENNKTKIKLNNFNITGIILLSSGISLLIPGITLILYDTLGYFPILNLKMQAFENDRTNVRLYDDYNTAYNTNIGLFVSGIVLTAVGAVCIIISIPLLLNKSIKKNPDISLGFGEKNSIFLCYKF